MASLRGRALMAAAACLACVHACAAFVVPHVSLRGSAGMPVATRCRRGAPVVLAAVGAPAAALPIEAAGLGGQCLARLRGEEPRQRSPPRLHGLTGPARDGAGGPDAAGGLTAALRDRHAAGRPVRAEAAKDFSGIAAPRARSDANVHTDDVRHPHGAHEHCHV